MSFVHYIVKWYNNFDFLEPGSMASNCSDGAVRLVGGGDNSLGRLEICINNAWGTVCRHNFGSLDAQVVCHQLGFPRQGKSELM